MNQHAPLAGIFTPNITPTDAKGRIDEDVLRNYIDWLIDHGVDGLYPNGSTGEFVRFTPEERLRVMQIVVEQTAGRVPILAGAAESNIEETVRACNTYADMGVRAVAIVAPFYFQLSADGVYEYFKAIATKSAVDVTLYNIPAFASLIDVATVAKLARECPRIVGIKDSSGDVVHMMRMITAVRSIRSDFFFMTGWDAALVPMLMIGANGGTNATSGVVPEVTKAIYQLAMAKQWESAMELQYRLTTLFDTILTASEFPEGFRRGAKLRNQNLGKSRQPLSEAQVRHADEVELKLKPMIDDLLALVKNKLI